MFKISVQHLKAFNLLTNVHLIQNTLI